MAMYRVTVDVHRSYLQEWEVEASCEEEAMFIYHKGTLIEEDINEPMGEFPESAEEI